MLVVCSQMRSLSAYSRTVTQRHMDLFTDLMDLSVSRYREVSPGFCLFTCLKIYIYCVCLVADITVAPLVNS